MVVVLDLHAAAGASRPGLGIAIYSDREAKGVGYVSFEFAIDHLQKITSQISTCTHGLGFVRRLD